jgi:5-(hydroxymethyl)furfural/furfural oxidase
MRRISGIFADPTLEGVASNPFASAFSDRVRSIGKDSLVNKALTGAAAMIMDRSTIGRKLLIDNFMAAGVSLAALVADETQLNAHVRRSAWGLWHPSGTCRMGRATDPETVVDPNGKLVGTRNLYVADASVFPDIPTYNINIPTVMVAERIADLLMRR